MSARTLISPARYVQGAGAIAELGTWVKALGTKVLVVADDLVWTITEQQVTDALNSAGMSASREPFGTYCTAEYIDGLAAKIRATGTDVVIGLGGGSTLDSAKAAGHLAGIRWVAVPTIASTDAPCSALVVVYKADGAFDEYRFLPHNPDLVLIDTQLVANAPVRLLVAGMGDALATWPEARACAMSHKATIAGGAQTESALALAKLSWDLIQENAFAALEAVRQHAVTPAVERIVEANTLLSGIGFESAGLAAAHAIHNGLTAVPQTRGLTHGEKVNVGTLTQFVLEGRPIAEIDAFIEFTTRLGLPNTLTELGVAADDLESLTTIAQAATAPGETMHNMPFEVTVPMLVAALQSIEGYATQLRARLGLPAPTRMSIGH